MAAPWAHRYAQRTKTAKSSIIRELLKITQRPEVISFAGGLPAPEVFPVERFQEACQRVLHTQAAAALQYGPTEGYRPLREYIVAHMARYGILASVDNVLITSGSQQALDLIAKLLINRGDRILVECPTYLGALQAFDLMGAEYVTVPTDEHGIQTCNMEHALRSGPKFMYILPNFQNPGGVTLSHSRREQLVILSDKYGIPIIEDDPYGQLRYEGEHNSPLVVLDRTNLTRDKDYKLGNVIYLSTFSKVLAPGLRVAWIVAPPDVIAKLVQIKQSTDLHTSMFTQMVVYEAARDGFIDEHVKIIRATYKERRDAMLQALNDYFPPEVSWTKPNGGLFLWVTMPPDVDSSKLLESALRQDVAFVPGDPFFPNGDEGSHMRLNFSNAKPEAIREGIRRLSIAVAHELEHRTAEVALV
ncbi:MAG TPA: PLP-dependent aminotransferase family protein [Verrucomicrobiae bacterium]|jgi:2-aminoadipate transaminase|nr:PLP-dependent aminotransferase family protein [Verrucomicrobiae bacterium]